MSTASERVSSAAGIVRPIRTVTVLSARLPAFRGNRTKGKARRLRSRVFPANRKPPRLV